MRSWTISQRPLLADSVLGVESGAGMWRLMAQAQQSDMRVQEWKPRVCVTFLAHSRNNWTTAGSSVLRETSSHTSHPSQFSEGVHWVNSA